MSQPRRGLGSSAIRSHLPLWRVMLGLALGISALTGWRCYALRTAPDAARAAATRSSVAGRTEAGAASDATLARRPAARDAGTIRIPAYPAAIQVGTFGPTPGKEVQLCQALSPAAPNPIDGVDCVGGCCPGEATWDARRPIPWQVFAQGEYIGPHRLQHVPEYRLRVDDQIEFIFRLTREETSTPYRLNVGDVIRVESLTDRDLDRELVIQPDGTITLRLLGQVKAARRTVEEMRLELDRLYTKYYKVPAITVTPLRVNTKLEDLRATIDGRAGRGGQSLTVLVTPEGTVQLPALGSVPAQGLSLTELKHEIDHRYEETIQGIDVTPVLSARAPRYVFVLGEVRAPGRYELTGPTTVMQSIALAGGWNNGGNLRQVVVFRRADDWRLMATRLDLRGALLGKRPCPADEIWVRDADLVIIPKSPILLADDFIELVFTRGIYGVVPFQGVTVGFSKLTSL